MTTAKHPPTMREILNQLVTTVLTPADKQAIDAFLAGLPTITGQLVRNELSSTAGALQRVAEILNTLADYSQKAPGSTAFEPAASPAGSTTAHPFPVTARATLPLPAVSLSATAYPAVVTGKAHIPTPTVTIIPSAPKTSRKTRRAAAQAAVFIMVWLSLTSVALENADHGDMLISLSGLNPWVAAASAAWLVGAAFDLLYPDGEDDE